jgi:hypothetical protein
MRLFSYSDAEQAFASKRGMPCCMLSRELLRRRSGAAWIVGASQ